MMPALVLVGSALLLQAEAETAVNPVYQAVRNEGLKVGDVTVKLPAPRLDQGASADVERAVLRQIAGSDRETAEFTRSSVTAPIVLKTRDEAVPQRGTIRLADLWFVVHAGLDEIKPDQATGSIDESQTIEAANMRFTLKNAGKARHDNGNREWLVRLSGRLLDRIQVEATQQIMASPGRDFWLIASRQALNSDDQGRSNHWFPIKTVAGRDEPGTSEPYPGGISYVKISRLATVPGALLVESHTAFFEPRAWFDGAPVLRSKIGVVAQDRVRALRRELVKSRKTGEDRSNHTDRRDD